MANNLSEQKRGMIFHLLCEGSGIRTISRITDVSVNTVMKLQETAYKNIQDFNNSFLQYLPVENIEADEIRTYVLKKQYNNIQEGTGTMWVYIALCRDTRLIIDFHVGRRDTNDAREFFKKVSSRVKDKTIMNTDCLKSYVSAIQNTDENTKWDGQQCMELQRARVFNGKHGRGITNRIESHNGVVRQHCSRLIRRTRGISKKKEKLIEHLTLFFFYYNFMKKHKTLKTTPAIAAKITDKIITIKDISPSCMVEIPKTRGKYKTKSTTNV